MPVWAALLALVGAIYLVQKYQQATAVASNPQVNAAVTSEPPTIQNSATVQNAVGTSNANIATEINQQNQTIATVGGVAAGAVSTLVAVGAVAGPVGAAIGAAIGAIIALVHSLISDVHLYANEIVQKYENPFGQYVIQLVTLISNEMNNNTLTLADAQAAYNGVTDAWAKYQAAMQQIASQGRDWYIVTHQSLNNLDNQYKGETLPNGKVLGVGMGGAFGDQANYGFMSSWIDWFHQRVIDQGGS